ncbi:unnamed protein product, partial [Porites lobata]
DPTDIVDGKPVERDAPVSKYLINGEQLGADDFVQDSTIIEGAEQADEMALPAEDYVDKPEECTKYQELNDFTRAQGYSRALYKCDTTLAAQPTWYRFTGESGSQMPTSCGPTNRCGTHAPGWLAGCHPPPGKISTVLVCFHWHGDCCRWHTFIRVRNCGGFFVYELKKPPACYLRYCGNSGHK